MLFSLKHTLKYYKVLLFIGLILFIFTQILTLIPPAQAEGSYELAQYGGNRSYLLYATDLESGIEYKNTIKVFVNAGEQVNVGSSVYQSFDNKDIVYIDPNGQEIGHCDVEDPTSALDPNKPIGLIKTIADENHGPEDPNDLSSADPPGYTPCKFTVDPNTGVTGIYKIVFHAPTNGSSSSNIPVARLANEEFLLDTSTTPPSVSTQKHSDQKVGIAAWDVTVFKSADNLNTKQVGRVYANYLPLSVPSIELIPTSIIDGIINSKLFILSKVGHLYKINLNSIQPGKFIFFANNKGFRDTSENSLLKSVLQAGANIHNPGIADDADNITYKIFFNTPDPNLPLDADSKGDWNNSITDKTWLHSDPPLPPSVTDFTFTGSEGTPNQAGTTNPHGGTFSFKTDRIGNYVLTINANKNNIYGDENDSVIIGRVADTVNPNTIDWSDVKDGNGDPLEVGTYKVKLLLSTDEVHFPFFDVEKNPNGLIIERLTSCSSGSSECNIVYYDDSSVGGKKKLDGEDSTNGAHQFSDNVTGDPTPLQGFGNKKGIDTWTSITAEPPASPLEINIKEVDLKVTKKHSPDNPFPGGAITYTIEVNSNDGLSDVTGIKVEDVVPSEISVLNWKCRVDHLEPGNRCAQTDGTGNNIDTTVDLTSGATAIFTVEGFINGSLAGGQEIKNTVTITTPNDVTNNPGGKTESVDDTIILVDPPSQPPTANNDSASTLANNSVTIPVLNNDSDDNGPLNISNVTTPKNGGTTQILTDGTIQYTPRAGFSGTDTFDYSVCDADDLCVVATVTVTVTSPPPPPPPPPPIVVKKLLSITIEGKGTVTSSPGSINCHSGVGICALGFNIDTSVALNAKPDSGWKFKEWKQDCDDNGEVTLSSDKQCEAIFVQVQQLTLTVLITGQGSVTAITPPGGINCGPDCTNEYAEGTQVVLQATPATDWQLEGWRGHCDEQGEVTLLETNKQCRAIFTPIITPLEPFKVTVYKTGQGTVISEPIGIDCGGTCSAQYDGSQGVQLIATPDPGWKLEGWRGHCDENGQVIRDNSSYNHAQCRVIFLVEPIPEPTPDPDPDNTPTTDTDKPGQDNDSDQSDNNSNDQPVDEDHDGVLTTTENSAPNSGDGNSDGIPDSRQNNVISLSTRGQYITVEETQGCQVQTNQPPAATAIDLNLSCSQADLKTYYHGVSDFQNLPSFQSVSTVSQTPPITYNTAIIQGQIVAVESISISDGGVDDSIAGDGQITYTFKLGSSPSHETQPATTDDSSGQINPLPSDDSSTDSVSTIIGQEIGGFNPHDITSQETTTGVNTESPTISRCLLFSSMTTQSSSWNQILQVGDTTTFTLNTGPGELFIKEMPDSSLVSVDRWQSLNGNMELSLTGLSTGDTQMTLSDSASSQQAILHITVIATTNHSVDTTLPLTEKEVKTLQTVMQIGQNIDLAVMGGQGSLAITQLPNSSLVSLTNWQNQTNGIAHFTLTGLDIGNTNLVITDEATPPQKTNVNISILAADNNNLVVEPTITCQGDTLGIDLQNRPNQACFIDKVISLGDLRSSAHVFTPIEAQNARVSVTVLISPNDVGQAAKILLVGRHTNLNGETNLYIRDDSRDKHSWQKWNGQIEQIPSSQYYPQLPEIIDVFIYEGDLSAMPGEFTVFVGYQLSNGIIIYNGLKPIHFWVGNN
ncbi:MAG: cadherin-like domain-containing protein [Thioploca sp.]|nr:cadherin-like domain-containing protein [Thioploca sp.]